MGRSIRSALAIVAGLAASASAQSLVPIVVTGDHPPSPENSYEFTNLGRPYINSSGALAFYAEWTHTEHGWGIYTWDSTYGLTLVAQRQPPSGLPFNYDVFGQLVSINDSGVVGFNAYLMGGSSFNDGVFSGTALSNVYAVARTGDDVYDETLTQIPNYVFAQLGYTNAGGPESRLVQVNNNGDIVFEATTHDTKAEEYHGGWWVLQNGTSTPRNIVRDGMTLPANTTSPHNFPGGDVISFSHADLAADGHAAFIGTISLGSFATADALYRGDPSTSLSSRFVFASASTIPTLPYNTGVLSWIAGPFLREPSYTGLQWSLGTLKDPFTAMLQSQGVSSPSEVVMAGTPPYPTTNWNYPAVNRSGVAVFATGIASASTQYTDTAIAYYADSSQPVRPPGDPFTCPIYGPLYFAANEGGPAQCLNDAPAEWYWGEFQTGDEGQDTYTMLQSINNNHQIVFIAGIYQIEGGNAVNQQRIIYGMDLRHNRRYEIARTGATVSGFGTITDIGMGRPSQQSIRDNADSGMATINDCGKVALWLRFYSGQSGLFTWQMPAPGDVNRDLSVNILDSNQFLNNFAAGSLCGADYNGDGCLNILDFGAFMNAFALGNFCSS